MSNGYGDKLRQSATEKDQISFLGVYDAFSASIAAKYSDGLFLSGFGFAASYYGLPDIGFIAWPDMVNFVHRVRTILPNHHLLVDIDDGYCDTEVACHVVSQLERVGASGIVLEDQRRPRKCGHFDGKELMEVDAYVDKLKRVLATRKDMFVIARTDASEIEDIVQRVDAFARAGADAILVDGLKDISVITVLRDRVDLPFAFNQIAGGKSPGCDLKELRDVGASLVIYSTPCLFAAQTAMEVAMKDLIRRGGALPPYEGGFVGVKDCTAILSENLNRRDAVDLEVVA